MPDKFEMISHDTVDGSFTALQQGDRDSAISIALSELSDQCRTECVGAQLLGRDEPHRSRRSRLREGE